MNASVLPWALPLAMGMLALAMVLCLVRILRKPTAQDRILALDAMYLNAMLLVLVLCIYWGSMVYFEAALLIAVLGFAASTALAKFLLRGEVIE
ncbi:K+/H+ antiporter subunit F [Comamonas sp. NLF-1-9]|uniref:K+/H+ antiporter subunit F n=1 Tax=Comamonas sp. NLF-1-9 TaxID=2853163 RepID=UPI001C479D9D|nr:K+/H+ antiporter subunit F [Comamonas sp. NLF-1-9]QXL85059.1 K+/H+ antiporter subunit F [Comamonas sp. NLF-1-9]